MNTVSENTKGKNVIPDNKNQVTSHLLDLEFNKLSKHCIPDLLSVV